MVCVEGQQQHNRKLHPQQMNQPQPSILHHQLVLLSLISIDYNIMQYLGFVKGLFVENFAMTKMYFARMLRQIGMEMERKGSDMTDDIAFMEPLNRHRNIISINDMRPILSPSVYIAPSATLVGNVYAGANVSFSFGSVARADVVPIRIGTNTSIGDYTVLQCSDNVPSEAFPQSLNIGNDVVIEDNCALTSCIVDDGVHIGSRSVVKEGCQLQRGCVIAPNSYVPAGSRIPEYTIWAGSPIRLVSKMSSQQIRERQKSLGEQQKERQKLQIPNDE